MFLFFNIKFIVRFFYFSSFILCLWFYLLIFYFDVLFMVNLGFIYFKELSSMGVGVMVFIWIFM